MELNKSNNPTKYRLRCVATGREFDDTGWLLDDPLCVTPSLIRAIYDDKRLEVGNDSCGLYKFAGWLPVRRALEGSSAPVTYRSEGLARELKLENLYITFSGYFPAIGAEMTTCSFKETEAFSVCGRLDPEQGKILAVASAGNTARAFAKVCSDNDIPLLLSVPEDNIDALWFEHPLNDCVKLISPASGGDYYDAIHLCNLALGSGRFLGEGGAKNVARRDGMATTVLSAVTHIGRIPDCYFQAVGSGTGAIAAWEANLRLVEDGRFGNNRMKLMLSQNAPFLPIYRAWAARSRELMPYDDGRARADAETITAKVLSNRRPPYAVAGGLYDALMDTDGDIIAVTNGELDEAAALFEKTEGIDIHPAAAVAVASLAKAVEEGKIGRRETVMLNITGGGEKHFKAGRKMWHLKPSLIFPLDPSPEKVIREVERLFYFSF